MRGMARRQQPRKISAWRYRCLRNIIAALKAAGEGRTQKVMRGEIAWAKTSAGKLESGEINGMLKRGNNEINNKNCHHRDVLP